MIQEVIYDERHNTYHLFVNGEWYAEGDFDYINRMYENNLEAYEENDFEEYDYDFDYGYESNMPCDTYGMTACSSSCSNYYKCYPNS